MSDTMDHGADVGWPLGSLEMRILRVLWDLRRATVREVLDVIRPDHRVAYTTIMTVMGRLADKGLLRRELSGKTYRYTPALTPAQFASSVSQRLVESMVAEFGELAIAQFAAELDRVDPERLRRLQAAAEGTSAP